MLMLLIVIEALSAFEEELYGTKWKLNALRSKLIKQNHLDNEVLPIIHF